MQNTALIEAFARLQSLKANLPPDHNTHEKYVEEYHSILTELEELSDTALTSFRVPATELDRIVTSGNYLTGETNYSRAKYCERAFFMMKLDGVLGFFEFVTAKQSKAPIGFRPAG